MKNQQIIESKALKSSSLDDLVRRRENIQAIIKDSETMLSELNDELMVRVLKSPEQKLETKDGKFVQLVKRVSFSSVPLEFAKKYHAVKKVVDSTVLKPLYDKGIQIPNVATSEYILVK